MAHKLFSSDNISSLSLLTLPFLAACQGVGTQEGKKLSHVNIVGGHPVSINSNDARRLSTVALTTDHRSARQTNANPLFDIGRSFCSATIISPRALMTAAHCIQDFDQQTYTKSSAFILPSSKDFIAYFGLKVTRDGHWMRAKKVIPHPDWDPDATLSGNPSKPAHDIGIVILESDIPEGYQPVEVASEDYILREKQKVSLVGFGVTLSRRNNNTGTLREVELPLQNVDTRAQTLNVGSFMKGACAGDSGGPMYVRDTSGKWTVIGVTSAGVEIFQTCMGVDNSYTDARPNKSWIRSVLRENGTDLL